MFPAEADVGLLWHESRDQGGSIFRNLESLHRTEDIFTS